MRYAYEIIIIDSIIDNTIDSIIYCILRLAEQYPYDYIISSYRGYGDYVGRGRGQ